MIDEVLRDEIFRTKFCPGISALVLCERGAILDALCHRRRAFVCAALEVGLFLVDPDLNDEIFFILFW